MTKPEVKVSLENALDYMVKWLRAPVKHSFSDYGYEMYLPNVMRHFVQEHFSIHYSESEPHLRKMSPTFYSAAWELCRRGILRPGIKSYGEQATPDGASGNGYSVTPFGRQWLAENDRDTFVPTEPERFGQLIEPYREVFGLGFHQRAQEAVRCYGAHAYLACCVMAGAAVESVLLNIAIQKTGNEEEVLREYQSAGGRKKIENLILGQASTKIKNGFFGFSELMKYWRDDAAHGKATTISDLEALTALALLLRFSAFAADNWSELISSKTAARSVEK